MNRTTFAPLAMMAILVIAGCDLSDKSTQTETRTFAPRILDILPSAFVRLEVAEVDLSNMTGSSKPNNGFYRNSQVPYSNKQISADGLPSDRKLYFRIAGLDTTGTPIWVTSGGVPDGDAPAVSVGYNTPYAPRTFSAPSITTSTSPTSPMISCNGGGTPAWTVDGSNPSSDNPSSTRYSASGTSYSINLASKEKLVARCTDRIVWSQSARYEYSGPSNPPNPTGPGGFFGNRTPTLNIPSTPSGQILITADTSGFASYSYWKIAYRMDQSASWNVMPASGNISIPFSASGSMAAYLIAWDGNNWQSGQAVYSNYPKFSFVGPGGALQSPILYVNTTGSSNSDINISAYTMGYSYTNWKAIYRLSNSGDTNWVPMDLTSSASSSMAYLSGIVGTGTIAAYLVAYNPTNQNWMSSPVVTAIYPAPTAIGSGTSFPAPGITLPNNYPGSPIINFDTTAYPNYSHWNLVTSTNSSSPSIATLPNASVWLSGSGTLNAYLVAWNGSSWVSGQSISKTYPPSPDSAVANGPGTDLGQVTIATPSNLPGLIQFSNTNTATTCPNCIDWKVAYLTQAKSGNKSPWKIVDLGTGVGVSDTGSITAYLMAWDGSRYKWIYGSSATANYPDQPTKPVILPPNGTAMTIGINLPVSLPDKITFYNMNQLSYTHWMVTYKASDMTDWRLMPIDSFYTMDANGSIYYYPMAWDPNNRRWVTGSQSFSNVTGGHSLTNPETVTSGGPLPAPIIHGKSALPADISFSLKLSSSDSTTYTSGSWKIVYQINNGGSWSLIDASATAYVPNYGASTTLTAYMEAWNPTTKRWVSGKDTTISLPIVVQVDAPVFKDSSGKVLGSSLEKEGLTLAMRIEGPGTIYYTTNGYDPDTTWAGSNTTRWTPNTKLLYTTEDAMTIKAISVIDGGFKSAVSSIQIARPSWVSRDNLASGCLSGNGTMVVSCGDGNGPWIWSHDGGWSALDGAWAYSSASLVKVTSSQVLVATTTGQVLRWNFKAGATAFEQIGTTSVGVGDLDVFQDTIWATTPTGPLFYDTALKSWLSPNYGSGTAPYFNGTPGRIWSDSTLNLWFIIGGSVYRYGPARGANISEGITTWYNGSSSSGSMWIGRDPLVPSGVAFGMSTYIYQLSTTPLGTMGSYMYSYNGAPVQVVSAGGAAFIASDNSAGAGGVSRQTSWTQGSNLTTLRKWPMISNTPISSQGVVKYTANGSTWLLASSLIGTYEFRVQAP